MGFSPLANMARRIQPGRRQSVRNSPIRGFTIHHQAGVNAHGMASDPRYEVSANYWITNEGVIIPNVDEDMRAWTTGAVGYPAGAESDRRNVTAEVSNSPEGIRTGTYAISDRALNSLEMLIGDVHRRHNLGPVKRGTSAGVAVHRDFVPTYCPGDFMVGRLPTIISNAERHRTGSSPTPEGNKVRILRNHKPNRRVVAGDAVRIPLDKNGNGTLRNDLDKNRVVTGAKVVNLTANFMITGKAGNKLRVYGQRRIFDDKKQLWVPHVAVGNKDFIIPSNGTIADQFTVNTFIPSGQRMLYLVKLLSGSGVNTVDNAYIHGWME